LKQKILLVTNGIDDDCVIFSPIRTRSYYYLGKGEEEETSNEEFFN